MPEQAEALADALVAHLADYDDRLAGIAAAAGIEEPVPACEEPHLHRLQGCIVRLRQVYTRRAVPTGGDLGALPATFGRFKIRRELGRGGFGIVYLAEDPQLKRLVALKVPRPEALVGEALRQRFLREGRAAASLDHPNVVQVYEAGEIGPICYIASAYCPGPNLAVWLKERNALVAPRLAAALVAALAEAVQHAHQRGVLHRDLKPANVVLVSRPDENAAEDLPFIPRLTDFGLAKVLEAETDQTTSGMILGTPPYMAPEQAEGWADGVGAATDVYSLGVILYELPTGQVPFLGPSVLRTFEQVHEGRVAAPRRLRPDVSTDLETVCLKCLRRESGQRYATAAALAEDLQRFLQGEPVRAKPVRWWQQLAGWCRRPERIRDARLAASAYAITHCGAASMGIMLVIARVFPVQNMVVAIAYLIAVFVFGGLLNAWIAWRTAPACPAALWAGPVGSVVHPAMGLLVSMGILPSGGLANTQDPSMAYAHVVFIGFVSAIQFVAYILALRAYYANRHVPGFLPTHAARRHDP